MIHELNIEKDRLERLASGELRAEIRRHDRDYQVGDTLRLFGGTEESWGFHRSRVYVERDDRGRFVNQWRDADPVVAYVTHVLPAEHIPGVVQGHCVLSIEVA